MVFGGFQEMSSKLMLSANDTQRLKDAGVRLFRRNDGAHRKQSLSARTIYFQVRVEAKTKNGNTRLSWSPMMTTGTRDELKAIDFAINEAKQQRLRALAGITTGKTTLKDAYSAFIQSSAYLNRSPATRRSHDHVFATYSKPNVPVFKTQDIETTSADDFFKMIQWRVKNQARLRKNLKYANATLTEDKITYQQVASEIAQIRHVLRWASQEGGLLLPVTQALTRFPTGKSLSKARHALDEWIDFGAKNRSHNTGFTKAEMKKIISTVESINETFNAGRSVPTDKGFYQNLPLCRSALAVMLAYSFGIRIQEIVKLQWTDLNMTGPVFKIHMADVAKTDTKQNTQDRRCFMPIHQPLIQSLVGHLRRFSEASNRYKNPDQMFYSGKQIQVDHKVRLAPILDLAGIDKTRTVGRRTTPLGFLALRRTTITLMVDSNNFTLEEVANRHGTSIEQCLNSYIRRDESMLRDKEIQIGNAFTLD